MERGTTLVLKVTIILMGLAILALCVFALPRIAVEAADYFPSYLAYSFFTIMYVSTLPFYFALYQAFKLLTLIDKNKAFSDASVNALMKIKYSAILISVLYVIGLPFLFMLAEFDDAPGIIVIGMAFAFAAFVVAVFAAVLQRLLKSALDIQSENELTV